MYGLYQIIYFTIIDIINTLKSPFFILIIGIIFVQYMKIGKMEKEIKGTKKSALLKLVVSTIFGIFGGVITTVVFLYSSVVIIPKDFMYILGVSMVLSFLNPRYMCFSYGGAIVSLSSLLFGYPKINISQVMSVVAVLHVVESILIFLDGIRNRLPFFLETDHQIAGGFNMTRFWPVPFVIFIGDGLIKPITLMAVLSYSDYSISSFPRKKVVTTSVALFIYSILLLYISKHIKQPWIGPLFAIIGHEYIIMQNKRNENKKAPIFTSLDRGVKVLDVLPNSIGHRLRIKTGDIILKINDVPINSKKDLDDLMMMEEKKLRIELFSIKLGLLTRRYSGEKKPLGLIIVPRDF